MIAKAKASIRSLLLRLRSSRIYLASIVANDALITRAASKFPSQSNKQIFRTVVLASNGNGNIGDQAMLNAIIRGTSGDILVILENDGALALESGDSARVKTIAVPGLVSLPPILRAASVLKLTRIVKKSESFVVVGADVMDGKYSPHHSVARISISRAVSRLGLNVRIIGFSWGDGANTFALDQLQLLSNTAKLLVRDPVSYARLQGKIESNLILTSDVVFSDLTTTTLAPQLATWTSTNPQFAIINCSGLIGKQIDQLPEYREVISFLRSKNIPILFLPHVLRQGDDDLAATRELYVQLGEENDYLVDYVCSPDVIRTLAAKAQIAVTGRMHLAVMGLGMGLPVVTLATQGKVAGLYEFFGLPQMVVEPNPGFGSNVVEVLNEALEHPDVVRLQITSNQQRVRDLSGLNFDE